MNSLSFRGELPVLIDEEHEGSSFLIGYHDYRKF